MHSRNTIPSRRQQLDTRLLRPIWDRRGGGHRTPAMSRKLAGSRKTARHMHQPQPIRHWFRRLVLGLNPTAISQFGEVRPSASLILFHISKAPVSSRQKGDVIDAITVKQVTRMVSPLVKRSEAVVAWYGSNEFAVLLQRIDFKGAVQLIEKMNRRLQSVGLALSSYSEPLTILLGVTYNSSHPTSSEHVLFVPNQAIDHDYLRDPARECL